MLLIGRKFLLNNLCVFGSRRQIILYTHLPLWMSMSSTRRIGLGAILGVSLAILLNFVESIGDWNDEDVQLFIMVAAFVGIIVAWLGPVLVSIVMSRTDTRDPFGGPACFALMIIVLLFGSMFLFSIAEWYTQGNVIFSFHIDAGVLIGFLGGWIAIFIDQRLEDRI